ncbi:hypothetical protein [Micromonospora carbonacea]|uniref:Uncharacterized protein n=1 Tax=Micromonospora carbonacea TaxID=47853 RepID=A0A1C4V8C3_9ACTN|nr:hypothetical protein [Micromonospora carbonacea]SCE80290.1 hypothetical protein GA0070563_102112 [Micromonospora carbonacea]
MPDTTPLEPTLLPASPEWRFLADTQVDQLAVLVPELAGQLHVERARVSTLGHALLTAGVLDRAALDAAAGDSTLSERTGEQLDRSLAGLMRVLTEDDDARTPLRADHRTAA